MSLLHPLAPAQHMQAPAHLVREDHQEPQPVTVHIAAQQLHLAHGQRLHSSKHQFHTPQHLALGALVTPHE